MSKSLRPFLTLAVLVPLAFAPAQDGLRAQDSACQVDTVPRPMLAERVRAAARTHGEFNIVATTNWIRFYSALYLGLVRDAMERRPGGGVLFLPTESLFREFFSASGLTDANQLPADLLWSLELGAGTWLEYRPGGIVQEVVRGPDPELAVNVRISWPDRDDGRDKYSFTDTLSEPQLRVSNRQVIMFRQLDFGDMVVHDEVEGTSVRALTGLLAAVSKVIGQANIKYSRSAVAQDGIQVMRVRAKRLFSVTATVTVNPDGRGDKDVPKDRPDLAAIEERLKQDLEIVYHPYRCW